MPCRDDRDDPAYLDSVNSNLRKQINFLEACLCGVLSVVDGKKGLVRGLDELLSRVDYKESGVSRRELERWWAQHKEEDQRRRAREAEQLVAQRKARELKERALSKLTAEDRRALGI